MILKKLKKNAFKMPQEKSHILMIMILVQNIHS